MSKYKPMLPSRGKGKEIFDYLRIQLGLPDGVTHLTVKMKAQDIVRVKCKYQPNDVAYCGLDLANKEDITVKP